LVTTVVAIRLNQRRFWCWIRRKTMNPITSFIKRHPQPVFWAIAYLTFFGGYLLYMMFPSDLWQFLIYGVALGGALVTAIADGRGGLRTYFSRIVRWRVGFVWYLIALFLPLAARTASIGLALLTGGELATDFQLPSWSSMLASFLFIFFTISLGEEPGFRGFALPRLMAGRSALTASLILGVLRAIWHLPLFLFAGDSWFTILLIIAGDVVFTWLFNNTAGSVLLAMIFHTSVDLNNQIFAPMLTGTSLQMQTIWLVVVYIAIAGALVVLTGKELGRRSAAPAEASAFKQPVTQ
jgi:uncharacterized protein